MGSNIEPKENLRRATQKLRGHFPAIRFSSVFRTQARDYEMQADFLNAVATFQTDDPPETILQKLQIIEQQLKKETTFRFGPRTIDLDILLYGNDTQEGSPTLPHPRMHERRFVLEPLCELIGPEALHPALGKTWKELLKKTMDQGCDKTSLAL